MMLRVPDMPAGLYPGFVFAMDALLSICSRYQEPSPSDKALGSGHFFTRNVEAVILTGASDLDSSVIFNGLPDFLSQPEPWTEKDEGYFLDTPSQAASHSAYTLSLDPMSPTASSPGLASQVSANDIWSTDLSSHMSEKMARWPSQDSMASHQWPRKPSIASVDSLVKPVDSHPALLSPISQAESLPSTSALADGLFSTFNDPVYNTEDDLTSDALSHLSMFGSEIPLPSLDIIQTRASVTWPSTETRRSSPLSLDDHWGAEHISASQASSPNAASASIGGQSPSKFHSHRSSFGSVSTQQRPGLFESASDFGPTHRSSPGESENTARDNPLYHTATPGSDGLYHCPWEKDGSCNHKPDKLKCNYDKFVDSHLKPYRCKVEACENARFSSTACLLRHEREAHAMHGHGDKPYLCTYEGCERAVPGYGFPRHWNLRDHMKRMHNDTTGGANSTPGTQIPALKGGRKRKAASSEKPPGKKSQTAVTVLPPSANLTLEPDQLDVWCQQRQLLEQAVRQLPQHPDLGSIKLLDEAAECLRNMHPVMNQLRQAADLLRQQSG